MSDMRTAITNAMESGKIETPAPTPAAAPAPAPAAAPGSPAPAPAPTVARDDAGRFAGKAEAKPAETAPAATPEKPASAATAPKYRPPQSWKPAVREKWTALPEDVQEEIDRVERAAADRIRKAGEAEKGYGALRQALTPYEAHLRASGKAVPEALGDALKLFTSLRSGSPQERASALANLINEAEQAGVGLDSINAILSQAPAQPAAQKPAEFRDPRFDQFMQAMQTRERARVSQTITDFAAKHEFFADVQDDIAGLMEAGIAKDLQTAYDYAVALPKHREIGAVLEQRKAAEAARTGNEATERAKQAASSPRASPVSGAGPAPSKLRDVIASHM